MLKLRGRNFQGRCAKHKAYNPAVEPEPTAKCSRCAKLAKVYEAAMRLNRAIRAFNPRYDDTRRKKNSGPLTPDPRQQLLFGETFAAIYEEERRLRALQHIHTRPPAQ